MADRPTFGSSASGSAWAKVTVLAPYLWLIAFFLVPFLIVLKISLSQTAIAQPPYLPVLDIAAGKPNARTAVRGAIYEHDIPDIERAEPGLLFRWVIDGEWKLVSSADGKSRELYHVTADPQELKDLAASEPERVQALVEKLLP